MAGMKLSDLDFVRLLPAYMREDETAQAIGAALNKLIGDPAKRLDTLSTWGHIDALTEAECDEMAWELDIDWYDSAGMTLEEKRATIKEAQQIKRKRGTKWAVESLIKTHLGEGYVLEWYEIEGAAPYTFMVMTTATEVTAEAYEKFVEAANIARNERSHIVGIFYYWQQGPENGVEYSQEERLLHYDFTQCGTVNGPAVVGFLVKSGVETEPEETSHMYTFPECGKDTFGATVGAPIVGTAIVDKAILAH